MIIHLLLGPLLLLLSIFFKAFPPKEINNLYGYRTSRSMKSQEAWDASNQYASKLMVWASILTCCIQVILYLIIPNEKIVILASTAALCLSLILILPITETYLKKNFR